MLILSRVHFVQNSFIQRNARKYTTIICGLNNDEEILKSYAKDLRKLLGCSCSLDKNHETQETNLKLSGKDTQKICSYLIENLNIRKENIEEKKNLEEKKICH